MRAAQMSCPCCCRQCCLGKLPLLSLSRCHIKSDSLLKNEQLGMKVNKCCLLHADQAMLC